MLRSTEELRGYAVRATDGDIGKVHGFYFDDRVWTIRYLVLDTGNWFEGRRVLLPTAALGMPDWAKQVFPVSLTAPAGQSSLHPPQPWHSSLNTMTWDTSFITAIAL